ncbi:pentapeptide repeat-containing protein [Frankia sp. Cr1]|uniref:pentapeptide repeat-containing protein n=1 Tax=Frankia sp. Cr1 TaxID=3073931 RepID=UPI003A1030E9
MGRPRSVSPRNTGPDDGLRIVVGAIQTGRQRAGAPADGPIGAPARGLSTNSRLNEANITKTYLKCVNLTNAWLYEADLTNAQRLIQEQVNHAQGNAAAKLPSEIGSASMRHSSSTASSQP